MYATEKILEVARYHTIIVKPQSLTTLELECDLCPSYASFIFADIRLVLCVHLHRQLATVVWVVNLKRDLALIQPRSRAV